MKKNLIQFDKASHTYKMLIDGELEPLLNASTLKKKYTRPFDSFSVSGKLAKAGGGDQMKIMKGWNAKGKIARNYGTAMHDTMEGYIKYNILPDDKYLQYFLQKFQELLDKMGIKKDDLKSELLAGNEELKIGGLIDVSHLLYILDLKTGNFKKKKKGNLIKPFNFLDDSPMGLCTLQLNVYSLFDEQGGKELKALWWDGRTFEVIDIPTFTDEQREILITEIKNYGKEI